MVEVCSNPNPWLFSAIYSSNDFAAKLNLLKELVDLSKKISEDWLIGIDFNEVIKGTKKVGGRGINNFRERKF